MDNKNALYKRPTTCFHCGNDVPMMTVGEYSYGSQDVGDWEFEFSFKYEMLACPVCKKVALRQLYNDETMIEEDAFNLPGRYGEERIIFPACTYESHCVPQKVREAYEAAQK